MDKQDKIVLEGVLQTFDHRTSSGRIYPREAFEEQIRIYKLQIRRDKINRIINNI